MKNLMTPILLIVLFTISWQLNAQKFGITAGLNMSDMLVSEEMSEEEETKLLPGLHVGPTLDLSFGKQLSLETGLYLTSKGYRISEEDEDVSVKGKLQFYYLDLPVKLKYTLPSSKNYNLFFEGGGYVGYGLSSKAKVTSDFLGSELTIEMDLWGEDADEWMDDSEIPRIDYGLVLGTGAVFGKNQLDISYKLGLKDLEESDQYSLKHSVLGLRYTRWF